MATRKFVSQEKQRKLEAFRFQLKKANNNIDLTDDQLWQFLKNFHLIAYDLDSDSSGILPFLFAIIASHSSEQPHLIWSRLIDAVQSANQSAGTLTFDTLPNDIQSIFLNSTNTRFKSDITRLKEHGAYILQGIKSTIGRVSIDQSDSLLELLDTVEKGGFIVVSGARGAGKSSLIQKFYEHVESDTPVFCIRCEELDYPHLDNVFNSLGIESSLAILDVNFSLIPRKYLIIESFEKLLELNNTSAFSDLLQFVRKNSSWTIVATCRDYAYSQITFNFLQSHDIRFQTVFIHEFSDEQVQQLFDQIDCFHVVTKNIQLRQLLKSPFLADLAYRALSTGTVFSATDGEQEFRKIIWRDVIAKESYRRNGMPTRRIKTFLDIAVKRAKLMVFGISESGLDSEALLALEADNLIRRNNTSSSASPAHDVLEDWALDHYIESSFIRNRDNIGSILEDIGHEPAMHRAFRLWLHRKIRFGEDIQYFICTILEDATIARYWQDSTIAAILQGDNPSTFIHSLRPQLLANEAGLLKRFCFVLRIACQAPIGVELKGTSPYLKPVGLGWGALIQFINSNKEELSQNLSTHIVALLKDWLTLVNVNNDLPDFSRDAGLVALHFLDQMKDSYESDAEEDRKKLFSIIIRTHMAIFDEFKELLCINVYDNENNNESRRSGWVDGLCEAIFSTLESVFIIKENPDLLVDLAFFEWFIQESNQDDHFFQSGIGTEESFGMYEYRNSFFPASGAKGPFKNFLILHGRKALDFILNIFNKAAEKYAHSSLDSLQGSYPRRQLFFSEIQVPQLELFLNDGIVVKQYATERLWLAYRGHSVVPYLLQSALMAFENWLVTYVELNDKQSIEWLFEYVLKNSNSVLPTAVLASVALSSPLKVGKAVLPLLKMPKFYLFDIRRMLNEMGGNEPNWFWQEKDGFSEIYTNERRVAALRPWRKEMLEHLIMRLQFSDLRSDALSVSNVTKN